MALVRCYIETVGADMWPSSTFNRLPGQLIAPRAYGKDEAKILTDYLNSI